MPTPASRRRRIRTGAEVADLRTAGGHVRGVVLASGERLAADHVVNAAGPWAGGLASATGVDLSMTPSRGVMVVLDGPAVGRVLNRCRPRSEGDVLVPVDGHPVAGTTDRPVDDPDDHPREAAEVAAVRESLSAVVPELRAASVVESYWGVRPLYGATDDATEASRGFAVRTERTRRRRSDRCRRTRRRSGRRRAGGPGARPSRERRQATERGDGRRADGERPTFCARRLPVCSDCSRSAASRGGRSC
ncbi:hypothetical protein BRD10_04585 [Halobacteriales archaeon SW_12_71_31]|nr:MAG: hypothetical protein BRD10_04585 [Halobacteriales archaeon SW_12_71_31]